MVQLPQWFADCEGRLFVAEAQDIVEENGLTAIPVWQFGDEPGKQIAFAAKELEVNTVMIGTTRRSALISLLRGEVLRTLANQLPTECRLIITS